MKLVVVGSGYVGLVTGICFAEFGHKTVCVDTNTTRISKLKSGVCPFYEKGIADLLSKHLDKTNLLSFSSSLEESMKDAEIVFITVGTPSRRLEEEADLSYVWSVSKDISKYINKYCLVVTKSTVPVGTTKKVKEIIEKKVSKEKFDVVSNPEFLREGSAIYDFMKPDRVVIGTENVKSEAVMRELYKPLSLQNIPLVFTSIETAEIIKYASNGFLATKISFINEISDLCEVTGANVQEVAKAMGIDERIGSKFLDAGPGYGGSCFPKDVTAFVSNAKKFNIELSILEAVHKSNKNRINKIAKKIMANTNKNSTLTILGLSFKPNTDDIRESTSIKLALILKDKGYNINCFDPKAMINAMKDYKEFNYFQNEFDACNNSEAIIIGTEWEEFKGLNFVKIGKIVKDRKIFDLRNICNRNELEKNGYIYYGTGK